MPELLGWWIYVVGVPLGLGALLTLFSLGGRSKKSARHSRGALKVARHTATVTGKTVSGKATPGKAVVAKAGAGKTASGKTATAKTASGDRSTNQSNTRQTRPAELPPLFLLQNFLLIWSLVALAALPFQPQHAAPIVLAMILGTVAIVSGALLAACAHLFVRVTPVDESSITLKSDLQGRIGECDAKIDASRGSLLVRDEFGTLHHLAARSEEPIARGEAVLLIEYLPGGDYFQVRRWRDESPSLS